MKRFARWLFMTTHRAELVVCKRLVLRKDEKPQTERMFSLGESSGVALALETLTLLVGQ